MKQPSCALTRAYIYILHIALLSTLTAGLIACSNSHRVADLLSRVDSLSASHPDSAVQLLDSLCGESQDWSKANRMRYHLLMARAMNKAETPFTSDSAMTLVANYYSDLGHKTNNMIEAKYLLGCVYRDLGDAPRAVSCYEEAVECADTVSAQCDYMLLCNIYSQMAEILFQQNLLVEFLSCLNQSVTYAYKAGNERAALNSYARKAIAYDRMNNPDSVISVCQIVYHRFCQLGDRQAAAQYTAMAVRANLTSGQLSEAKHWMNIYEEESGYFDRNRRITNGRESYYSIKGQYYLATCQYDSAEYWFRQEVSQGSDFNNQNMGAKGLATVYEHRNIPDSAAKYALYSYAMNDSAYATMATKEVKRVQALYNYKHHKIAAQKQKKKFEQEQHKTMLLQLVIAILVLAAVGFYFRQQRHKRELYRQYKAKLCTLENLQAEIDKLKSGKNELQELLREKESSVKEMQREIAEYQEKVESTSIETDNRLSKLPLYQDLQKKSYQGKELNDDAWEAFVELISVNLPNFSNLLSSNQHLLNTNEYHVCILVRMNIHPMPISTMMGISPSTVTKCCKSLMKKLFIKSGNYKDLYNELKDFC